MAKDQPNKLPMGMDMADIPAGFDHDRMEEVVKIKCQASDKFKEGDYFSAKCLYAGALEMLERCCLHLDKADETWEGIKNNMALCDLKRNEFTRVVETTTEVLARNPSNAKALYRRGVAKAGQGNFQDAQRDLRALVDMEPDNGDARHRLSEVSQQLKTKKTHEKDQAEKMRGFLRGERLDDTVAISEDGGVRKLHGNENAPLFSSWIKRQWLNPNSGVSAVVTCHIVMKTPAGKEVFNTRKPPGALKPQQVGPQQVGQSKPAIRPVEPVRWVLDDSYGCSFKAWQAAVKSLSIGEVGRFEVAKHTMGPSVEGAIERVMKQWLGNTPARKQMFKDVPEDIRSAAARRQALQILCLPEDFCMEVVTDPNTTYNMELELMQVNEFMDLYGDGRHLMQVIREGRRGSSGGPAVTDLSTVTGHFRVAKLLMNYSLKDTRLGLATSSDGLVMKEDRTKDPIEFIVGEEEACPAGEYTPPCIGHCLMIPPGGVYEGMQFELILRDGVPVSHMEKSIRDAYHEGTMNSMPDTTGPVVIRIEVDKVEPPIMGPSTVGWKGVESIQSERRRAEELEIIDSKKHGSKALKRWRRIIVWLEQVLDGRKWKLQGGKDAGGDSMYDLEWEDEEGSDDNGRKAQVDALDARLGGASAKNVLPDLFEVEEELLRQFSDEELGEWATAHAAAARLIEDSDKELCRKHAKCAVHASEIGRIPKEAECSGRSLLAARLMESSNTAEALEVLRVAQSLDPTSQDLKDQAARCTQKDNDRKTVDMKEALRLMKQDLNDSLESNDMSGLLMLLEEIDGLPLTWEAVSETAIGKEVGKCAKLQDQGVAEKAKGIISTLHKLAKAQRPLWVR